MTIPDKKTSTVQYALYSVVDLISLEVAKLKAPNYNHYALSDAAVEVDRDILLSEWIVVVHVKYDRPAQAEDIAHMEQSIKTIVGKYLNPEAGPTRVLVDFLSSR